MNSKRNGGVMILTLMIFTIASFVISMHLTMNMRDLKIVQGIGENEFSSNNESQIKTYKRCSKSVAMLEKLKESKKEDILSGKLNLEECRHLMKFNITTFNFKHSYLDNVSVTAKEISEEDKLYNFYCLYECRSNYAKKKYYCDLIYKIESEDIVLKNLVFGEIDD